MRQHNTVPVTQRGTTLQPRRQDIDRQIVQLLADINLNCLRIGKLAQAGNNDKAAERCAIVVRQKARVLELVANREALQAEKALPEKVIVKAPATKTVIARKTYKRFAKK